MLGSVGVELFAVSVVKPKPFLASYLSVRIRSVFVDQVSSCYLVNWSAFDQSWGFYCWLLPCPRTSCYIPGCKKRSNKPECQHISFYKLPSGNDLHY